MFVLACDFGPYDGGSLGPKSQSNTQVVVYMPAESFHMIFGDNVCHLWFCMVAFLFEGNSSVGWKKDKDEAVPKHFLLYRSKLQCIPTSERNLTSFKSFKILQVLTLMPQLTFSHQRKLFILEGFSNFYDIREHWSVRKSPMEKETLQKNKNRTVFSYISSICFFLCWLFSCIVVCQQRSLFLVLEFFQLHNLN